MKTKIKVSLFLQGIFSAHKVFECMILICKMTNVRPALQDSSNLAASPWSFDRGSWVKLSRLTCRSWADSTPCATTSWYWWCFRLPGNFLMLQTAVETVLLLSSLWLSDTEEAGSRTRRHSFPFLFCSKPTTVRLWPAGGHRRHSHSCCNITDSVSDSNTSVPLFCRKRCNKRFNSGQMNNLCWRQDQYRGAAGKVVARRCWWVGEAVYWSCWSDWNTVWPSRRAEGGCRRVRLLGGSQWCERWKTQRTNL